MIVKALGPDSVVHGATWGQEVGCDAEIKYLDNFQNKMSRVYSEPEVMDYPQRHQNQKKKNKYPIHSQLVSLDVVENAQCSRMQK